MASLVTFVLPTRAIDANDVSGNFENLYIREADANTMDSYVQASLGGYVYKDVDGVTQPTVSNNFGSRYAGEAWADLSVFAWDQKVMAGIPANLNSDGNFVNNTLWLGRHTDGIDSTVEMLPYSDFLNVFSVLGSSQMLNDNVSLPLDVVFVLDTSSTMVYSSGDYYRLTKAANALNEAMKTVMENPNNRIGFVTFDFNSETYLQLDHYEPITVRDNSYSYADDEGVNHVYGYHDCFDRTPEELKNTFVTFDRRIDANSPTFSANVTAYIKNGVLVSEEDGGAATPIDKLQYKAVTRKDNDKNANYSIPIRNEAGNYEVQSTYKTMKDLFDFGNINSLIKDAEIMRQGWDEIYDHQDDKIDYVYNPILDPEIL